MAFNRLQEIGEERFRKIINALMRGEHAIKVARTIQQQPPEGWGLFQDVTETALTRQLDRLRLASAEGLFGPRVAKKIAEGATPQIKMLENVSIRVIDRLEELSETQRTRMLTLVAKEKAIPSMSAAIMDATNTTFAEYRQTLLDLQKIRFDLGLDDFKGPITSTTTRGASASVSLPDGTNVQRQVFEAVTTIEQIFNKRNIPALAG